MFLLFISALGGIAVWGPWGALLGPIVVRLWMEAVELYREAQRKQAAASRLNV
jgi:predicted PurR-regulated permease PerM